MKLILAIFAAFAVSTYAVPLEINQRALRDDFRDFLALVPFDKINDLFMEYLGEDEEFQSAMDYIMSDEFTSLLQEIENMPEIKRFMNSLVQRGLPVYEYINKLNDYLNIPKITPVFRGLVRKVSPPGVKGFLERVRALVPQKALEELYHKKLETSAEFRDFVNYLKSEKSQQFINKLMANPKVQKFFTVAEQHGVDVQKVLDYVTSMLGLKFPSRPHGFLKHSEELWGEISQVFSEFEKLLNKGDLYAKYKAQDINFRKSIQYISSDDFRYHLAKVEGIQEFTDVLNFLDEIGLPVYTVINMINQALDLPNLHPVVKQQQDLGGFSGYLKAWKNLLPMAEINKLFAEKMQTSPVFNKFVHQLKSEKAKQLFNYLGAHSAAQEFLSALNQNGIDFVEYMNVCGQAYGLHNSVSKSYLFELRKEKTLGEELKDFINLVPVYRIKDLAMYYMSNDNQFQELVDYILSDECKEAVKSIEAIPAVKNFLKYLHEHGVPIYEHLNKIHEFIDLEPFHPSLIRDVGGVKGFFEEVKTLIPEKELRALYEEKLKTSKVFAEFVAKLKSPEAQKLVNQIMDNPGVQSLMQKLKSWDVNFKEVFAVVTQILGIQFPNVKY